MFNINRSFLSSVCCVYKKLYKFSTTSTVNNIMLKYNVNALSSKTILNKYLELPLPECLSIAKYIWIDGTGKNVRCKTRTLDFIPKCVQEIPVWTFDGSSTYQADPKDSDIYLCPRAMYCDPLNPGNNVLVLCDTYNANRKPTKTNYRFSCEEAINSVAEQEPWFGIEQEFTFLDADKRPLGWPSFGFPAPEGPYYCAVGADKIMVREIIEAHYRACLYAGVQIYGANAEVMPGQWEYQIGPGLGIKCADDIWISRFLLLYIAEEFGVIVSFDPKPMENWDGAGAHCCFSTKVTRADGGIKVIEQYIDKLLKKHKEHMAVYDAKGGKDNKRRLTGKHGTGHFDKFNSGVATRSVSVRIPRGVCDAQKGFFEDRRPAANCDPYRVCEAIIRTCLLDQ